MGFDWWRQSLHVTENLLYSGCQCWSDTLTNRQASSFFSTNPSDPRELYSVYLSSSLPIFTEHLLWARMWTEQNPHIHETQSSGERDLKYINTYMMPGKMFDFFNGWYACTAILDGRLESISALSSPSSTK